jgi:glycosyltransferase involved in cell wall biosynthesis
VRSINVTLPASVIICTYNRATLLKRTLEALSRQTIAPDRYELIVVDDGSQDDTSEVCDMMRSKLSNLKYFFADNNSGTARARNSGISKASGYYILFVDDDCIPREDWLEKMLYALIKEPIVAGAVKSTHSDYYKICHNIAQFHAFMPGGKTGYIEFLAGANMGFQRHVFEELQGFKEDEVYAEDMEFIIRSRQRGYRPFFAHDAVVIHDPDRDTITSIFKYSAVHASRTITLRNRYRTVLKTPFILRSPFLILAAAPVIAFKVTASIYLKNPDLAKYFKTIPMVYALKLAWCWGAARGLRQKRKEGLNELLKTSCTVNGCSRDYSWRASLWRSFPGRSLDDKSMQCQMYPLFFSFALC